MLLLPRGAWAGEYTRLCIAQGCSDFAPIPTNNPTNLGDLQPDPTLDPFFVLSTICSIPAPSRRALPPTAAALITNKREGQWEAVSFYFNAAPPAGDITPATLTLPSDPASVIPAFVVMSQGVLASPDGTDTAGLSANYPAQAGTQTSPPSPTTGTENSATTGEITDLRCRSFARLRHLRHPQEPVHAHPVRDHSGSEPGGAGRRRCRGQPRHRGGRGGRRDFNNPRNDHRHRSPRRCHQFLEPRRPGCF